MCFCILDVNDCVNVTCENGGTCLDGIESFTCLCVEGFSGEHCQIGKCLHKEISFIISNKKSRSAESYSFFCLEPPRSP